MAQKCKEGECSSDLFSRAVNNCIRIQELETLSRQLAFTPSNEIINLRSNFLCNNVTKEEIAQLVDAFIGRCVIDEFFSFDRVGNSKKHATHKILCVGLQSDVASAISDASFASDLQQAKTTLLSRFDAIFRRYLSARTYGFAFF